MKLSYFPVAQCNGYRTKIRLVRYLLNIKLKCASALFYTTRRPYFLVEKRYFLSYKHEKTIMACSYLIFYKYLLHFELLGQQVFM